MISELKGIRINKSVCIATIISRSMNGTQTQFTQTLVKIRIFEVINMKAKETRT